MQAIEQRSGPAHDMTNGAEGAFLSRFGLRYRDVQDQRVFAMR